MTNGFWALLPSLELLSNFKSMKYNLLNYTWNLAVTLQWNSVVGKHSTPWHFCYIYISGHIFTLNVQTTIYFTPKTEWEPVWQPSGFTFLGIGWRPAFLVTNIYAYVINPDITFCSLCPLLPYFSMVFAKSKWMLFSVWGLWMHSRPDGHHLSDDFVSARASPACLTCWEHSHPLCCPFRRTCN